MSKWVPLFDFVWYLENDRYDRDINQEKLNWWNWFPFTWNWFCKGYMTYEHWNS